MREMIKEVAQAEMSLQRMKYDRAYKLAGVLEDSLQFLTEEGFEDTAMDLLQDTHVLLCRAKNKLKLLAIGVCND